jgi:DnaJ-class molecular chaperone
VFEEEKQECPKCLGKGYFIHIFEIVPKSVTCHKCDGVGTIYEHDKCESCFGFGFSVEDNVAAKGCPVCASSGNVKGDRCEKCGGLGLVDFATGEKLSSDQDCPDCDGKGYREIPEECSECSGTGEIIEIDTEVEITPTMNQP